MRITALLGSCALAAAGCTQRYQLELWNDTQHAVDVEITEQRGGAARADRRATMDPGGWFDFDIRSDRAYRDRWARVHVRDVDSQVEFDLSGRKDIHARIRLDEGHVAVESMSAAEARKRRRKD